MYEWKPFQSPHERAYLGLHRNKFLVCSIVQALEGWQSVTGLDKPRMRPDDKAEVLRKLEKMGAEEKG